MFTVLFTSIGRRVELVNAFKSSYKAHGIDAKIIGVDANPKFAPAAYFVDQAKQIPPVSEKSYIDYLLMICRQLKVNVIIPLYEPEFFLLEKYREEFSRIRTILLLSEKKVLKICQDKLMTYRFFLKHGIRTPSTWLPGQLPGKSPFPLIIKPRCGMGSRGLQRIDSYNQLHSYLPFSNGDIIIQEFISGIEFTLDIMTNLEGKVISVVPRERLEVRDGEVSKSRTVYREDLLRQGKDITEKLKAVGPVTLQCIDTGNGVYWLEINPRFGGGVPLSIAAGVDYPLIIYQLYHQKHIPTQIGNFKENYTMLRFDNAIYF